MRLLLAAVGALVALALFAVPATAGPVPLPPAPSPTTPAAAKKDAHLRVWIVSGLEDGGKLWQLQDGKVSVRGNIRPYVKHQTVLVVIRNAGHRLVAYRLPVKKGKHRKGRLHASLAGEGTG